MSTLATIKLASLLQPEPGKSMASKAPNSWPRPNVLTSNLIMPTRTKFQQLQDKLKLRKDDKAVFGRFAGDGRLQMICEAMPRGTHPMKCSRSSARFAIMSFIQLGQSQHSASGGLIWVMKEWADDVKLTIKIQQHVFDGQKSGFSVRMTAYARREFLKRVDIEDYV